MQARISIIIVIIDVYDAFDANDVEDFSYEYSWRMCNLVYYRRMYSAKVGVSLSVFFFRDFSRKKNVLRFFFADFGAKRRIFFADFLRICGREAVELFLRIFLRILRLAFFLWISPKIIHPNCVILSFWRPKSLQK